MGTSGSRVAMASAKEFVEQLLVNKKVVVLSKSYCPYCAKAKSELAKFKINPAVFEVVELDSRGDGDSIQDYCLTLTGARSVPRVFIGGKFIGGGDDTVKLSASGELEELLKSAGAIEN